MSIRSLTFSPDSQLLITASDDNHIKMYDVYHSFSKGRKGREGKVKGRGGCT